MTALVLEVLLLAAPLAWHLQRRPCPLPALDPRPAFLRSAEQLARAHAHEQTHLDYEELLVTIDSPLLPHVLRRTRDLQRQGLTATAAKATVVHLTRTGQLQ